MTESERAKLQRGLAVLNEVKEFGLAVQFAREVAGLLLVVPDRFSPWADQLYRAAVSIPCNVSEAQGRQTPKQVIQYYRVARGSAWECLSLIYAAPDGVQVGNLAEQLALISRHIDETMLREAASDFA